MKNWNSNLAFWDLWGARPATSLQATKSTDPIKSPYDMNHPLLVALRLFAALTVLTGIAYPLLVTAFARITFPEKSEGSLVSHQDRIIGSKWLAQSFTSAAHFWPRPSSANYGTVASGGSNKGPISSDLKKAMDERAQLLRVAHGLSADAPLPAELLFASGSGLDPHLRPETVRFQLPRVALARGFNEEQTKGLDALIEQFIEPPQLGLLGEPRVNVLLLNLALEGIKQAR
jgi:K+-transporting ATPase ATPase C chain